MTDEILVFGPIPGCIKCKKALEVAERVASDLGIVARKCDILSEEADELGVMISPTVAFRGEVLVSGQPFAYEKLRGMVEERIGRK